MTDTTTTSVNLADLGAHLRSSKTITDDIAPDIDSAAVRELRVAAACGSYAPEGAAINLADITRSWRDNDAKLQTIYDVLIAGGGSGTITLDTQDLRDDVADANGRVAGSDYEIRDDGLDYVVDGLDGDDTIIVDQNADGTVTVTVNGDVVNLTPEDTERLLIEGGDGDDIITVNPHTPPTIAGPGGRPLLAPGALPALGFRINGGEDNDTITGGRGDDEIDAGNGRNYVDAGRGDDTVHGGDGFDTIYGGLGEDRLFGGEGDDYLDGGRGADLVSGQAGNDIVAGGDGQDELYGGADDDVIIGGRGKDTISDRRSGDNDSVFAQAEDTVDVDTANEGNIDVTPVYAPATSQISINGTEEFQDRVQSDLDTMAAVPATAAILRSLDGNTGGHTVTIGVGDNEASTTGSGNVWEKGGTTGSGKSGEIGYDVSKTRLYPNSPDEDWMDTPPMVILAHEMLHTEDYVNGTLDPGMSEQVEHDDTGNPTVDAAGNNVAQTDTAGNNRTANNRELSVVGLPFDEADEDTSTGAPTSPASDVDANGRTTTENSVREVLKLPARDWY